MENHELTTPDEILAVALAKEEEAYDFYAGLANQCELEVVRELLEKLKDEEAKHSHLIQNLITNLNLGKNIV